MDGKGCVENMAEHLEHPEHYEIAVRPNMRCNTAYVLQLYI